MNYMKKTIRTILCTAFLAVLAASCQKEIEKAEPVSGARESIEISINGLMGEYTQVDATKSELVNTVRVAWEGGESVYVYDGISYLGSLASMLDGNDNRYAILSGTIDAPAGNKLLLVHSPLLKEAPAIEGGMLSVSLAEQTTGKAPFVVYATLDYTDGNITGAIVPFTFATSVVRVNCTGLEPGTAISSAEISNVNTSCVLTFEDGAVTASGAEEGSITRLAANGFDNVNIEGDASFQFAVPDLGTSTVRTLTVRQGDVEHIDANFSTASIKPNHSVNTICTMRDKDSITADSPVGTIGFLAGRKAMVVNLCGKKYAVALMNEGATADSGAESNGSYVDYDEASSFFHDSVLNVWRVPTMEEMKALTDNTREYDSTTPAVKFVSAGGAISFPLAGLYSSEAGGIVESGHGLYYTSTPTTNEEGDLVCFIDSVDGQPYVEYHANATPELFKLSLRLFYQLTETYIQGRFTVNASGKQVYFSKGNLQATYNGSSYIWGFAQNQYDILGYFNGGNSRHDLFGWSTGLTYYGISKSSDNNDYRGDFVDWGTAVDGNIWRTLSSDEWNYLLNTRTVNGGTGYGNTCTWATIKAGEYDEIKGLIIFCDDYSGSTDELYTIPDGCVFLPAAGNLFGGEYTETDNLQYWSSTPSPSPEMKHMAQYLYFHYNSTYQSEAIISNYTRNVGCAVRLVTDCE